MPLLEIQKLLQRIKQKEGLRLQLYTCPSGKISIGYGRNLEDVGLHDRSEAEFLLENDIKICMMQLRKRFTWFEDLDGVRQAALVDMTFNMGLGSLLTFKNTLAAIVNKQWDTAADEALDSKWATQVGKRAIEVAHMLRTGTWPKED